MRQLLLIAPILILMSIPMAPMEGVFAQERTYEEMRAEVGRLFEEELFSEASVLLADGLERYPDHVMSNCFNLAFVYIQLEMYELSIGALDYGLNHGIWYGKYGFMNPAFEPLTTLPGWEDIVVRNEEAMAQARLESEPQIEVVLPEGYDPAITYPLFIALHGGGENIQNFKPRWTSPSLREEFIVLYPQSSLPIAMDGYNWMEDMEVSREEIQDAYEEVLGQYPVDPERVIVGGFSAGGVAALDVVMQGVVSVQGFVTLCPPRPESFSTEAVVAARERGVRGTILTTEMDPRVGDQREMVAVMDSEGFPHQFFVTPNTGHWYPDDLSESIDEAIRHIRAGGH